MPAKKPRQQPKQPKDNVSGVDTISIDGITVPDTEVIDLNNYVMPSSYTLGSGIGSISGSITIPTSYTTSYTTTGSTLSYNSAWTDSSVNITSDGITMKEGSDIKIGSKSLTDVIEKIEERLAILHPNPELEEKWENLKGLRKAYMDLEAEILEKEKMWNILKKA
jgi:hypothetical protein